MLRSEFPRHSKNAWKFRATFAQKCPAMVGGALWDLSLGGLADQFLTSKGANSGGL